MKNLIIKVEPESIAEEIDIKAGDFLCKINEKEVEDIFDYRYLIKEEYLELVIEKATGEIYIYEIEKDEDEDLGIIFENALINMAKSCKNNCIFCFVDQLPKGLRETLYFKDDDSRLSFLQGNYVTLTNMKDEDIDRIIFYHLSPINISIHSTDPSLREFMLKNPESSNIKKQLDKFFQNKISMNFQIVLCKSVNDCDNLDKTIKDLGEYIPLAKSLSVVPVGITNFRKNLFPLESFTKEESLNIINQLETWNKKFKAKFGTSFVFASDEFYLLAEKEIPNFDYYENFPQIENGVGMIASFKDEFFTAFDSMTSKNISKNNISIVTGKAAYSFIVSLVSNFKLKFPGKNIEIFPIENKFFGEKITVSGLITGSDILAQLKDKKLEGTLLVPENILKADEDLFLDNMTLEELSKKLKINIEVVKIDGREFLDKLIIDYEGE